MIKKGHITPGIACVLLQARTWNPGRFPVYETPTKLIGKLAEERKQFAYEGYLAFRRGWIAR